MGIEIIFSLILLILKKNMIGIILLKMKKEKRKNFILYQRLYTIKIILI